MERTVQVLFGIGLILNVVKGADLILRPHQQKWVQDKFESLVLWLEYARPIDWFVRRKGAETIYQLQFIVVLPIFMLGAFIATKLSKLSTPWLMVLPLVLLVVVFGLEQIDTFRKVNMGKNIGSELENSMLVGPLIRWLFVNPSLKARVVRHLCVIGLGVLGVFLFPTPVALIPLRMNSILKVLFFIIATLLTITFLIFVLMGAISLFVVLISLLLLLGELILKVIRGLTWRIAEFNKGAFAAIILIFTIGLGVTEFYLKYQPRESRETSPAQTSPSKLGTSPVFNITFHLNLNF